MPPKAVPASRPRDAKTGSKDKDLEIKIPGPTKAALWLLSIDEEIAVDTLGQLNDGEVRMLAKAVQELGRPDAQTLVAVHHEFNKTLQEQPFLLRGSFDYLGKIATKALGESKAIQLLQQPADATAIQEEKVPPSLKKADINLLASALRKEHPQLIAAVLANLDEIKSGDVLQKLPSEIQPTIINRIAKLKRVPQEALAHVEHILSAGMPTSSKQDATIDGVKIAAGMLNKLKPETVEDILNEMPEESRQIATEIRQAMFTFEDLNQLDRKGLQMLLKEVQSDQLLMALKTASEELKEKFFTSLSKRAAEMLRDDMAVMGPVRVADVEAGQQAIVAIALQLRAEGKLNISGQGGEDFV